MDTLPPDIAALIFDCDGTLVDTLPSHGKAWAAGFALSGLEMPLAWYFARAGMSEQPMMDAFEADHAVTLPRDEVIRVMRQAFVDAMADLQEIEAVAAIARSYRGRLPMAVASGGTRSIVTESLRITGLLPLFDTVVTMDDVTRAKPEPDLFLEAARRMGVAPARCMVFEDSREGLEAARRAGMARIDVLDLTGAKPL